jgi:hypothetical protein
MIDMLHGTMRLETARYEKIERWEVWFRTMEGLFTNLPDAVESAQKTEMPVEMIRPVAVALDKHGHYEEVHK